MELNKILEGITPVGISEGDKVIIEVVHGTPVIHFEPAKNENFLDDMVEDEDEDLEEVDEEDEEDYDGEGSDCCDGDCEHCKEYEKDIRMATMLQKVLEDLKNIMKS